jgi:hypothetical protein
MDLLLKPERSAMPSIVVVKCALLRSGELERALLTLNLGFKQEHFYASIGGLAGMF